MDTPVKRFLWYLSENILKKYFFVFYNNLTGLNLVLFYYSCLYIISGLTIFIIWILLCILINKTKLEDPKITIGYLSDSNKIKVPYIKGSSFLVYIFHWSFIGAIIGFHLLFFIITFIKFIHYSSCPQTSCSNNQ
jgi:hypothetical protein